MTPLEMIAEWRKGCTIAGPLRGTNPAECAECTEALIAAIEQSLRGQETDWHSVSEHG